MTIIPEGKLQLEEGCVQFIDHDGVIRFTATTEGEWPFASIWESGDEVVMRVTSMGRDEKPAQVVVRIDVETASTKEMEPPYRSVRFELQENQQRSDEPTRVKMQWTCDMEKLKSEVDRSKVFSEENNIQEPSEAVEPGHQRWNEELLIEFAD